MTIKELIDTLNKYDKNADVKLEIDDGYTFHTDILDIKVENGVVLIVGHE